MLMKRIAIDMDEVLADSNMRYFEWYEQDFGEPFPVSLLDGKKPREVVADDRRERVKSYPHLPGFFRDLPVMTESQRVVSRLMEHYEIFITTAAMEFRHSFIEKYEWLEAHFPFIHWRNIVFCGDKSIIHADYMIDDNTFNLDTFVGQGLLFTAPHNKNEDQYIRVDNWKEIEIWFMDQLHT